MKLPDADTMRVEQINLLCQHMPLIAGGSLITSVVVVFVLRNMIDLDFLLSWFGWVAALSLLRFLTLLVYRRWPTSSANSKSRLALLTLYSFASASLWGWLGYIAITPDNPVAGVFVIMVFTGVVASAIASLAHCLPVFYAFVFPVMLPAAIRFLTFGDEMSVTIGVLCLLFSAVSVFFAHGLKNAIVASINLKYENLDLIEGLREQQMRADEARRTAEQANVAKSKFLAAASHDLRQPLNALSLFAATLEQRVRDPETRAVVDNIGVSVTALKGLFDALLDISKLDAGTLHECKTHFPLQTLLDRLHNDYLLEAQGKKLRFLVDPANTVVYSDAALLEQVLRNLVGNAVRYTQRGKVHVISRIADGTVTVEVVDTGPGIAEEHRETIFDEFVQLENPERDRSKGLGLGLSIVKRIAALLGHTVAVESAPGKGSVFSITLPLGNPAAVTRLPPVAPAPEHDDPLIDLFVVVIDDEQSIRQGMAAVLGDWGCRVLTAGSGDEALAHLAEYDSLPDAILADYRLREHKTGVEAVSQIRAYCGASPIPALIITGDTAADRLNEAEASGLQLLHKPFRPAQLRQFLRRVAATMEGRVPDGTVRAR